MATLRSGLLTPLGRGESGHDGGRLLSGFRAGEGFYLLVGGLGGDCRSGGSSHAISGGVEAPRFPPSVVSTGAFTGVPLGLLLIN